MTAPPWAAAPPPAGDSLGHSAEEALPLIGRERHLGLVTNRLRSGARLVNLHGPAGIGKSALARQVVRELGPSFRTVRQVTLGPSQVTAGPLLADPMGPPDLPGPRLVPARTSASAPRGPRLPSERSLWVLDNAEASPALSDLSDLLARRPDLHVLTITTAPMPGAAGVAVDPLSRADARRLLVDRAAVVAPNIDLEGSAEVWVDQICEALEGLPLALVLAAHCLVRMSHQATADALAQHRALTTLSRYGAVPGVGESLSMTCAHLRPSAMDVLSLAGVFADAFTVEALISVTGRATGGELCQDVHRLIDLHLLQPVGDGAHYRLSNLVKELARLHLGQTVTSGKLEWASKPSTQPTQCLLAVPLVPRARTAVSSEQHDLTPRELQVLEQIVAGLRNKEIAESLHVTPKTVMHHSVAIYRKLGVRGRSEAAVLAVGRGLVPRSSVSR